MTVPPTHVPLIVDPDAEARDQYGAILTTLAPEVEYAEDGREALAKAIGHSPRFMITETDLRFIDGYTLCSLLRADPLTADVPIVVITGDADPHDIKRARSSGADTVLIKPCQPEALLRAVTLGRDPSRTSEERVRARPERTMGQAMRSDTSNDSAAAPTSRFLIRAHRRFETSTPPIAPPPLRCPSCYRELQYVRSHIGGVSARLSEQWDYYICPNACGSFQYRERTRRLRRV